MKNVLATGITSSSQQPYTKKTHEWYNDMTKEVGEAFVKSLIPSSWYTGKLVILSGCELTGTNPSLRTISEGWVWYDGEIFRVEAGEFTTTGLEIGIWSISTNADNLIFSDGASKPVTQERTFVMSNGLSGSGLFDESSTNIKTQGKWISGATTLLFSAVTGDGLTLNSGSSKVAYVISGNTLFYKVGLTFTVSDATEINSGANISAQIELIRNIGLQSNNISGVLDIGMAQYTPLNGFASAAEISTSELRIFPIPRYKYC